jgi:DNA polymerase elongation subunit (family B)
MRVLLLDIETSPHVAYVWNLINNQYINPDMLVHQGRTLCWAAKWYGEDEVLFSSTRRSKPKTMIKQIHKLIDEADAVIHYNGTKFDLPILNQEFLLHGLSPASPVKQVDLLKTVRSKFRFPSNKLSYVSQKLGLGSKVEHKGFALWEGCLRGDPDDWDTMERYNKQDVVLLEALYEKLKPWIKSPPNHSTFTGNEVCPNCGSSNLKKRGMAHTATRSYQRYCCGECGAWSRSVRAEKQPVALLAPL